MSAAAEERPEAAQGVRIAVEGDRLLISVGVGLLAHAIQEGKDWPRGMAIVDVHAFAAAMGFELGREDGETGLSPLQALFDQLAGEVCESGLDCIEDRPRSEGLLIARQAMGAAA